MAALSSYLTDGLGSTVALADMFGSPTTTYTYDPFGKTSQSGAASDNPFQYTGRENDGNGLYHYRARQYSPSTQRFISEDPIGLAGGDANFHAYVGGDPIGRSDPSGLIFSEVFGPGGVIDDAAPDTVSNFAAGALDGAFVGFPSAAFGVKGMCWGRGYGTGKVSGAVGGAALSGGSAAVALGAGRGLNGLAAAGAAGGAVGGTHATAGMNPDASPDELARGALLGVPGGFAGGMFASAARGAGRPRWRGLVRGAPRPAQSSSSGPPSMESRLREDITTADEWPPADRHRKRAGGGLAGSHSPGTRCGSCRGWRSPRAQHGGYCGTRWARSRT